MGAGIGGWRLRDRDERIAPLKRLRSFVWVREAGL
jgi:hypothetical protein